MGGTVGVGAGVGAAVSGASRAPQLLQKTLSIWLTVPHVGHVTLDGGLSRAPQLLQNLLPSRF